ncbi:uncharacterized protein LOC142339813 [Convolutriloba macropyga]|uniref:uncharacterized protein LOC142339813 n=1 Tax=Convolutriloba macropyga TaxID=536237 RepID=UPI003F51AD10
MTIAKSACDLPLPQPPVKNVSSQSPESNPHTRQKSVDNQTTCLNTCQMSEQPSNPEVRGTDSVSQSSEQFIRQLLEELSISNYYEELSSDASVKFGNSDKGYGSITDNYESIPSTMESNSIYSHIYQYLVPSQTSVYNSEGSLCSTDEKISQIYEEIYSIIHSEDYNSSFESETDNHSESSGYEEITSQRHYAIRSLPTPLKCPSENSELKIQRFSSESAVLSGKKSSQSNSNGPEYLVPKVSLTSTAQKDDSSKFDRKNLLRKPLRSKQPISDSKKSDVMNILKSSKSQNILANDVKSSNMRHGNECDNSLGKDKAKTLVKNVVYWNETSL